MDPKPIQKPHVPIIVGGYADAAFDRAVRFGAGWYGFNLDPARTKQMLEKLDAAFAKAGRKRTPDYEIIITPPLNAGPDTVKAYADARRPSPGRQPRQPAGREGRPAPARDRDLREAGGVDFFPDHEPPARSWRSKPQPVDPVGDDAEDRRLHAGRGATARPRRRPSARPGSCSRPCNVRRRSGPSLCLSDRVCGRPPACKSFRRRSDRGDAGRMSGLFVRPYGTAHQDGFRNPGS